MAKDWEQERIQEVETQYQQSQIIADFAAARHYQEELNYLRNQRTDNINMQMNKMFIPKSVAIDPADLYGRPGSVVPMDGSYVTWIGDEDPQAFEKRKQLDQKRNLKLFIHFARTFMERFPNWEVQPDPNSPFKNVMLVHKNNKYRIESAYPDNEVRCYGVETEAQITSDRFAKRQGIPPGMFRVGPSTVPTYTFFGWAIGMEDVPEWVRE